MLLSRTSLPVRPLHVAGLRPRAQVVRPRAVPAAASSDAASARAWINSWRARSNAADARAWIDAWRASSSAPAAADPVAVAAAVAREYGPKLALVGTLFAADAGLKAAATAAGVTFPPALAGMLALTAALVALPRAASDAVAAAVAPGLDWIARWLPLFYVPSLVVLPVALKGIAAPDIAKMLAVVVAGMPATLIATAALAVAIRSAVGTPLAPTPAPAAPAPFSRRHYIGWSAIGAASLLAVAAGVGGLAARTGAMLAATVLGYVCGVAAPPAVRAVLHPVVACAGAANVAAALLGAVTGDGYAATLAAYLTKGAAGAAAGAGDILMSLLGVVILSYGFRIAAEKDLIRRHAAEIGGAAVGSAAFSLFATALAARAVGLAPEFARALVPRSVTVALALPIAAQLGAPASIAAAGVVLTGLLGANCAQPLLDAARYKDPIARGLATAGAAHGLGTAALARSEPDALPFCALGYALIGVAATVLASLPPVTAALLAITAA